MKTTFKLVAALLCSLPLLAQPAPSPDQVLREILQLDDAQVTAVHALMTARVAAIDPLQRQAQEAEARVGQLLSAPTTDPCEVGAAVAALHSIRRQVEQHQETFRQGLQAILNDEQRQRVGFIFGVENALRAAGALHQIGL
jgi:Spy/CpxP family protein refolding chaperone